MPPSPSTGSLPEMSPSPRASPSITVALPSKPSDSEITKRLCSPPPGFTHAICDRFSVSRTQHSVPSPTLDAWRIAIDGYAYPFRCSAATQTGVGVKRETPTQPSTTGSHHSSHVDERNGWERSCKQPNAISTQKHTSNPNTLESMAWRMEDADTRHGTYVRALGSPALHRHTLVVTNTDINWLWRPRSTV
jgi:hypothetical protein